MLAKKHRLSAEDFLSNDHRTTRSEHFVLKFWPNQLKSNRFGVSIAARTEKSAVRRHHLKRRIYENLKNWPNQGLDILFIYSKKTNTPTSALQEELPGLLRSLSKITAIKIN